MVIRSKKIFVHFIWLSKLDQQPKINYQLLNFKSISWVQRLKILYLALSCLCMVQKLHVHVAHQITFKFIIKILDRKNVSIVIKEAIVLSNVKFVACTNQATIYSLLYLLYWFLCQCCRKISIEVLSLIDQILIFASQVRVTYTLFVTREWTFLFCVKREIYQDIFFP